MLKTLVKCMAKTAEDSAKSAGGRLQLNTHTCGIHVALRMWLLLNRASALVTTCP